MRLTTIHANIGKGRYNFQFTASDEADLEVLVYSASSKAFQFTASDEADREKQEKHFVH